MRPGRCMRLRQRNGRQNKRLIKRVGCTMREKDNSAEQTDPLANTRQSLRLRAEERLLEKAALSPKNLKAMSPEETQRTLHELLVHQIELEMQNDELKQAQTELND